jgi:hypothetical protein
MKREDKKAALAAYKERKAEPGVYVVRCTTTDQIWVGTAPELTAIWNCLSFSLRQGAQTPASLQAAWKEHGPENFTFEPVEALTDEQLVFGRDRMLKERRAHWCEALEAEAI